MRKLLVFLALVTTCLLAKADASGTCGANITWVYTTADNTLTISGTGDMSNYTSTTMPWKSYKSSIKNVIIDDGVTSIGTSAFYGCSGLASVTIPDAVTSIGEGAFRGCGLTSVTIPDAVTSIGDYAFGGCVGLTSVIIGNAVTSIGSHAFDGCHDLTSVTIGNAVTSIGTYAFCGSGLTSVTIGNAVTSIGTRAFGDGVCANLTKVTINSNAIAASANLRTTFGDQVTEYVLGENITSIGSSAFHNCTKLTNVTIPDGVTSIGAGAFEGCSSLASVTIPIAVTSIENYTFYGCSNLTGFTIPDAVISIGNNAFYGCSGFKTLTIPAQVSKIDRDAFKECSDLYEIEFKGSIPPTTTSVSGRYDFRSEDIPSSALIIVPCGTSALYRAKFHENETGDDTRGYFGGYSLIENCGTIHNNSYTIETSDVNAGTVSGANGASVGETVTLTATPKEGYRFKQWSDGNTENPRTVTITEGMNLKAEFEILVFTINVVPNNVSYGSASGSGEYEYGNTAFIMASANNGYKFVKWNDGNTAVIRTIKVKKDSAFVAEFTKDESAVTPSTPTGSYTIGAADPDGGSVSVDGEAGIGKTVTLTATPKDGYKFKQWSDGNTENPRIVTITNGMNLKAEFEAYERTWKLNALEWNEDSTKVTVYFYCPEDGKTKSVEAKPVVVEQAATCHEKGSKKRVVTVAFEGQIYEESVETVVDAPRQNIVKKMWGDVLTVVDPNKEFIQYEWYRNGEFVSNKAYVSEAGGLTGEYTLQVTKRDGSKVCSNTVTMSEKRSSAALRVYPNPATDNVTIEGDFAEGSEIRIVDMNGVLVKKTKAATDGRATVMTSGMTAGAYTVIAGDDTARLIKK